MAKKSFTQEYESIGVFLILELLALVSFGLGGINSIFHIAGFVVALISLLFSFKNFCKEDLVPVLCLGAPLFLMSIFTSFGKYFEQYSFISNLGAFLAILSFFMTGLAARRTKSFSTKNMLLCIGGGLALIVLISTISTWVQYGLFYPLIHKNASAYYYNGNLYSIQNEMSWLVGFKFIEVSQNYGGLFAILAASMLVGLLFINPKEDKKTFIMFAVIGGIGFISIISIPNIPALIFLIITYLVAVFYRFLRNNALALKILKYIVLVLFGLFVVFFLICLFNAAGTDLTNIIQSNGFLNRIFNSNRFMQYVNPVLVAAIKPWNLFGITTTEYVNGYIFSTKDILTSTGIFEVEIIKEGGLLGFVAFVIFLMFAYKTFANYLKKSKDNDYIKVILLGLVVAYFLYMTFESDVFPETHSGNAYSPITRSLPFLIMLFVIGYVTYPANKDEIEFKEEVIQEKPEEESKEKDDYDFSDVEEEKVQ